MALHTACLINARSVNNSKKTPSANNLDEQKSEKIKSYILNKQFSLFVVSETWVKPGKEGHTALKKCCPPGYDVEHHQPRNSKGGGGVALLYKREFVTVVPGMQCYSPAHWEFEYLDLQLKIKDLAKPNIKHQLHLIIIYNPPEPSKVDFLEDFEFLMKKVAKKTSENLIVLGDFNIQVDDLNESITRQLLGFIEFSRLKQHVKKPTREKHILDLVLSYKVDGNLVSNITINEKQFISDHDPVEFDLILPSTKLIPNKQQTKVTAISNKPDNALIVQQKYKNFTSDQLMKNKSVTALPGIGDANGKKLKNDGIKKVLVGRTSPPFIKSPFNHCHISFRHTSCWACFYGGKWTRIFSLSGSFRGMVLIAITRKILIILCWDGAINFSKFYQIHLNDVHPITYIIYYSNNFLHLFSHVGMWCYVNK